MIKKHQILFFGSISSQKKVEELSGGSIAGNKMQINIIDELSKYNDVELHILSLLSVARYPIDKKVFIRKSVVKISDEICVIQIPFVNIFLIKQVTQIVSSYIQALIILYHVKIDVLFSFNLFPEMGVAFSLLSNNRKRKSVALLADLPIDDQYNRKGISIIFRYLYDHLTRKMISKCDNLIVLNKNAAIDYAPNANYIVIEGAADQREISNDIIDYSLKTRKNILYTGTLAEYSGVLELLESIQYVTDENVILEICGEGKYVKNILEYQDKYSNIKYLGKLDNFTTRKLQKEAYILINPRHQNDKISRVTFPSKVFEYLISGTVVLSTKLSGFSDDYLDKVFFIESNAPKDIANGISSILKQDIKELNEMALKARTFIKYNKTWDIQTKKIHQFLIS